MKKHYDFIYPGDQGCSDSQTGSLNEEKNKKHIFEFFLWNHTCICSLLLHQGRRRKGKLRKFSKKCVLCSPCLLSVCFCFFPKQLVRFPDKKSWDFALSFLALLSSCFPSHSFIQTEAFVHSIWSWTEGKYYYSLMFWTDTNQASLCSAPPGFHVKLFPCSKGLTVPFFRAVIWVLWLCRAGLSSAVQRTLPARLRQACTAEIQVLCLGKASAETFSSLQSQKRESSSYIWPLTVDREQYRAQKLKWFEGKALLQGQSGKKYLKDNIQTSLEAANSLFIIFPYFHLTLTILPFLDAFLFQLFH